MIETKIEVFKIDHQGKELDAYIPQINIGFGWVNIIGKGYILKEGNNPVEVCKSCGGNGCQNCKQRGTVRGIAKDQKHIAQIFLDDAVEKISKSIIILDKFK